MSKTITLNRVPFGGVFVSYEDGAEGRELAGYTELELLAELSRRAQRS